MGCFVFNLSPGPAPVHPINLAPSLAPEWISLSVALTLAQIQCSAKSEIFVFPETSDEFSRSHVI